MPVRSLAAEGILEVAVAATDPTSYTGATLGLRVQGSSDEGLGFGVAIRFRVEGFRGGGSGVGG